MNLSRVLSRALSFLSRALCLPFLAGHTEIDNPDRFTSQFGPHVEIPHSIQNPEESNGLDLGEHSSELTSGNKRKCVLITHICATDITIRLRRVPVGFYVAVKTENGTERTSNKPVSISKDVIEWDEEIVLPSDRSGRTSLAVFASFELGPTLGNGEVLLEFTTTVGELLNSHGQSIESVKQSNGKVNSSPSSFKVKAEQRTHDQYEFVATLKPSESEEMRQLGELTDMGHLALNRYRELQEQQDLGESISYFQRTQDLCPPNHPNRATVLFNLATAKLIYCRTNNVPSDLNMSIDLCRDVLHLRPRGHPDHPFTLLTLGVALEARFQRENDEADKSEGESLLSQVLDVAPLDSYTYLAAALALGSFATPELVESMEVFKTMENDLDNEDQEVQRLDVALQWISHANSCRHALLDHLGILFCIRLSRLGDLGDPEKATSIREIIVQSTPDTHPDRISWLNDLGISLLNRFEDFGYRVDLEKSISMFEDAVQLTPDGHSDKPLLLNNLSRSLSTRYEHFGDVIDLKKSINLLEDVVQSTPDDHPNKPSWLNNLSYALSTRYQCFGDDTDLEKSVSLRENAVQLTPDCHPDKSSWLNNLGHSLSTRYERFGDVTDLQRSISLFEDALRLTSDGHPDKPLRINNLGDSLLTRYVRFGEVMDLEMSISLFEVAVQFTPDDHSKRSLRLNNLGMSLQTRYSRLGDILDLEKSISLFKDAIQLTPDGHPDKPLRLSNLGLSLVILYERLECVADLEESISLFEEVLPLTPYDSADKPLRLNNLSHSLWTRYKLLGDDADLERSISLSEDALQSTPDSHPDKLLWISNLGSFLFTRYEHFEDVAALEKSIALFEDVLRLTPDDHPGKPQYLGNLALALFERFKRSGDLSSPDFSRAILYSSNAARSHAGPSLRRLRACQIWILCIRLLRHDSQSLVDAYTVVVDLLPQLAWIGSSLTDRYHQLLQAVVDACEAAAAALDVHRPELAVEWLEQGRSIVWSQFSQLRTPVDDLRSVYPELAAQFQRVSRDLELAGARDGVAISELRNHSNRQPEGGVLEEVRQYQKLVVSRERLLTEIRAKPCFERFLLPKTIKQLSYLAHSGTVVFLNASRHRCDALVVMAGSEHIVHVPLSNTKYDEVVRMQLQLNEVLRLSGRTMLRDNSQRGARVQGMTPDDVFRSTLLYLWEKVVSPILVVLPLSKPDSKLPRIFWCPTGPFSFLPIHAAGVFGSTKLGPKLSDFAISSYVPTMNALELPSQEDQEATPHDIRLLGVLQPSTDGQVHLTGVRAEIESIRNLASASPFVGFQEADGIVEDVLSKMTETDWVHFACHAMQDHTHPYDSGFILAHGKRLNLTDIARLSRPHGGLAFLSACHTATGDEQLPEEAIHLAAGMLLAGYRGVIATMWSIMDDVAPRVTEDVYGNLFSNGRVPDSRRAAEALHQAIERLRNSGVSFLSWVPFIHVGL